MTDNELNKAVHKWMSVKCTPMPDLEHHFGGNYEVFRCRRCNRAEVNVFESLCPFMPDYCNGYNAVREFLKAAIDEVGEQIVSNYMPDVDGDSYEIDMLRSAMLPIRELAEAGAKAVGIWRKNAN